MKWSAIKNNSSFHQLFAVNLVEHTGQRFFCMADENYWGLKLAPRTKKNASGHNYACTPKGGRCNAQFGRMEQYNSVSKNQTKTSGVGQRDRNLANQRSDDNQRGKWNEVYYSNLFLSPRYRCGIQPY